MILIEKSSKHPHIPPYYRPKSSRNYAHEYIFALSGIISVEYQLSNKNSSNLVHIQHFLPLFFSWSMFQKNQYIITWGKNHYNILFLVLLLLLLVLLLLLPLLLVLLLLLLLLLLPLQRLLLVLLILLTLLLQLILCINPKHLFHNTLISDITNLYYEGTYCDNNLST